MIYDRVDTSTGIRIYVNRAGTYTYIVMVRGNIDSSEAHA